GALLSASQTFDVGRVANGIGCVLLLAPAGFTASSTTREDPVTVTLRFPLYDCSVCTGQRISTHSTGPAYMIVEIILTVSCPDLRLHRDCSGFLLSVLLGTQTC
ncbi:hypothetical protein TraAM80_10446, partial [Trypanosoma rangeli]